MSGRGGVSSPSGTRLLPLLSGGQLSICRQPPVAESLRAWGLPRFQHSRGQVRMGGGTLASQDSALVVDFGGGGGSGGRRSAQQHYPGLWVKP